MARTQRSTKQAGRSKKAAAPARGKRSALTCEDCGFVAAHPMGLGRHRSTRHGAVSKRQMMRGAAGGGGAWLTRQEAAERAGVHYNTIRQWEQSGVVKTQRRGRSILIDGRDLSRARGAGAGASGPTVEELQRFYAELTTGLKRLLDAAEASSKALARAGSSKGGAAKPAARKPAAGRRTRKAGRRR